MTTALPAPPRQRLLEAAIGLMRRSGLSGAGINEIVRESGAPKGSVYHFFPGGKQQIVLESLAAYAPGIRAVFAQGLARGRTPADRVRALFRGFARRIEANDFCRSCAGGTVTLDLDEGEEAIRRAIAAMFADWIAVIAARLDLGGPRRSRSFAGLVLTAIEGAYVRARAERSSAAFREAGDWLAELAAASAPTSRSAPSRSSAGRRARPAPPRSAPRGSRAPRGRRA